MKRLIVCLSFITFSAFAASGAHSGHVSDLLYPAINFTILMTFFFWKVLPMIKKGFANNHKEISESYSLAEIKEVEAQTELSAIEHKLANLTKETNSIHEASNHEAKSFEQSYVAETNQRITRSQQELEKRVEGEKNDALSNIMNELLEEIVAGAKKSVSGDSSKKKKIIESFSAKL
jgi:F-type H+-transporting ATPase subunit b